MDMYIFDSKNFDFFKFPVVPKEIKVSSPQKNETFESLSLGDLKVIGLKGNKVLTIECFFPVIDYPFLRDRNYKGMQYIDKLEKWRDERLPMHLVITDIEFSSKIVINNLEYGVQDGSGDIYYTLDIETYLEPNVKSSIADSEVVLPNSQQNIKEKKIVTVPESTTTERFKNSYAVVTVNKSNIRSGPSKKYKIIGSASKGDKLKIVRLQGTFWQILYNGKTAFIYSSNVRRS